jgi:hypothetical protein
VLSNASHIIVVQAAMSFPSATKEFPGDAVVTAQAPCSHTWMHTRAATEEVVLLLVWTGGAVLVGV